MHTGPPCICRVRKYPAYARDAQDHVRPALALRRSASHAPEQRRCREARVVQRRREQGVVLEALAAAPLISELALDVGDFGADRAAGLNRQVLEEERFAMREVQTAQRLQRGVARRRLTDTAKVDQFTLP